MSTTPGPVVLAVANHEAGVAKTTSVASIGAALGELGESVLLVDLDEVALNLRRGARSRAKARR